MKSNNDAGDGCLLVMEVTPEPAATSLVDHPSYYKHGGIEVIDVIDDWGLAFCEGNILKYVERAGRKNAKTALEDLNKAIWYTRHAANTYLSAAYHPSPSKDRRYPLPAVLAAWDLSPQLKSAVAHLYSAASREHDYRSCMFQVEIYIRSEIERTTA